MIEQLVQFALNNSLAALILATIVWASTRVWRNPYVTHVLWGLVFLKLICPTWVSLSLPVASTPSKRPVITTPAATKPLVEPQQFEAVINQREQFDPISHDAIDEYFPHEQINDDTFTATIQPNELSPFTLEDQTKKEASFSDEQAAIAFEEPSPLKEIPPHPIVEARLPAVVKISSQKPITQVRPTHLAVIAAAPIAVAVPLISFSWQTIFLCTSLFGTAIWLLIVARRIAKFRQCVQLAEPVSQDVLNKAESIANQLGLRHLPAIRWVDGSLPPMLWFSGRDLCILLPRELWNSLTAEKQRLVLAHELIHVKRRDHIFRWVETIIFGLYWWNPVVWFARRHFHTAEDACCDQRTLTLYPEHIADYGDLLVDSASFVSQSHLPLATFAGGIGHPHTLKTRVQSMLENTKRGPLSWPIRCLLAICCCMFLAVSTQLYSADESQPEAEESIAEAGESETTNEDSFSSEAEAGDAESNPTSFDDAAASETTNDEDVFSSESANTESKPTSFNDGAAEESSTSEEAIGAEPEAFNAESLFDDNASTSDDFGSAPAESASSDDELGGEPANTTSGDNDPFQHKQTSKSNSNINQPNTEIQSGDSENIPVTSAREKAQAALIAAIADPDPEVSEQAMLAVKRLGLISDNQNNKSLTPKLKAVMQLIAKNPDANLSKRLEATIMLIPSKEHSELVLQVLLDCHVRAKKREEANNALLHLYQVLERTPSEVISKSCQDVTVSHNLKQLYKKIKQFSLFLPHRDNNTPSVDTQVEFNAAPQTVLSNLSTNVVQQLTMQLAVASILAGNSEIATEAFLEGYAADMMSLAPITLTGVDTEAHIEETGFPPTVQAHPVVDHHRLSTDELGTILKLFRPETDAVLEFYISQMKSDNPKLRQLATAVLGNSLSGDTSQNVSNNSRRSRGLSFGGGGEDRRRTSRDNDPFTNNVRTSNSMFGKRNLAKLDEATQNRIRIRYQQFVVIQRQLNAIYQQKQKQHAQTHSDFSDDVDASFDRHPRKNRKQKEESKKDIFAPTGSNDAPEYIEGQPIFEAPKKKPKATTSTDDFGPGRSAEPKTDKPERSGGGFF